jgi:hypothetical protein
VGAQHPVAPFVGIEQNRNWRRLDAGIAMGNQQTKRTRPYQLMKPLEPAFSETGGDVHGNLRSWLAEGQSISHGGVRPGPGNLFKTAGPDITGQRTWCCLTPKPAGSPMRIAFAVTMMGH